MREQDRPGRKGCSWRFWARGNTGNDLLCGLLRDSSDSIGRPYPLLVAGGGFLSSWENHWELLPRVCEGTWRQLEYVSARKFDNLEKLEGELLRTRPPRPDWSDAPSTDAETTLPESLSRLSPPLKDRVPKGVVRLPLNDSGGIAGDDKDDAILNRVLHMNAAMKNSFAKTPGAVFLGGSLERSFAVFFFRAINAEDFASLWLPEGDNN